MLKPAYKVRHDYSACPEIPLEIGGGPGGWSCCGAVTKSIPAEEYYLNKYNPGSESSSDFFVQSLCDHKHSTS